LRLRRELRKKQMMDSLTPGDEVTPCAADAGTVATGTGTPIGRHVSTAVWPPPRPDRGRRLSGACTPSSVAPSSESRTALTDKLERLRAWKKEKEAGTPIALNLPKTPSRERPKDSPLATFARSTMRSGGVGSLSQPTLVRGLLSSSSCVFGHAVVVVGLGGGGGGGRGGGTKRQRPGRSGGRRRRRRRRRGGGQREVWKVGGARRFEGSDRASSLSQ
jgi:hypothetical protein